MAHGTLMHFCAMAGHYRASEADGSGRPGANLYTCAISTPNNWIYAVDDITADQHCAAIGAVVQSKILCAAGGDVGTDPPPAGGDGSHDSAGADEGSAAGSGARPTKRGQ